MISQSLTNDIGNGKGKKEKGNIEKVSKEKFQPPTLDEIKSGIKNDYPEFSDKFISEFSEGFHAHYTLSNWKYGKQKIQITDWKLCLATWKIKNEWNIFQEKNKSHKQFNSEKTKL